MTKFEQAMKPLTPEVQTLSQVLMGARSVSFVLHKRRGWLCTAVGNPSVEIWIDEELAKPASAYNEVDLRMLRHRARGQQKLRMMKEKV